MKPSKLEEKLLGLRLQKKDPEAFAKIYDLYVIAIYRFIYFKVSSAQDAEDLTSEVFLKAWQYARQSEEVIENLRAFIYKVARNLVIDFYRQRAKREYNADDEVLLNVKDERQQSLLSAIEAKVELNNIEKVLRNLKEEYREILVLRYLEDLSIGEISKVLDKSKGSIRVLIHRALKVSRDLVNQNHNGKE